MQASNNRERKWQESVLVPVKPGAVRAQVNGPVIETERLNFLRTRRGDDTERGQWKA
jgi:hypothetical protein